MCKYVHWQSVLDTKLYYVSELRLARHHKSNDFPAAGDTVQFLADRILGTAVIEKAYQNGYGAHFELTNIDTFMAKDSCVHSTDILKKASNHILSNIELLEMELKHDYIIIKTRLPTCSSIKKKIPCGFAAFTVYSNRL
jgi:hypothetical protein